MLPQCSHRERSHKCFHITRKRGVYYYRRRLPSPPGGEIAVSLGTSNYREAEHKATLLDHVFEAARATMTTTPADLQKTLRDYLRSTLDIDAEARMNTAPGKPVYAGSRDGEDPVDTDLEVIDDLLGDAREALSPRRDGAGRPRHRTR
jgi:hypothetical protein